MTEKNSRKNETVDALFDAILSLESREECYAFFEDLCTVKEISDMAQRLEAAKLLLGGRTYDQIVKEVEISTATISRINRCIQYGTGGYQSVIEKISAQEKKQQRLHGRGHRMGYTLYRKDESPMATINCPTTLECPALPRVTLSQAVIDLMESIALQESALSHILCAESQKMKTALAMNEIDLCKLLEVNDSATNMVHAVANLELVLKEKLEFISNNLYYPSADNGAAAQ